ncbi:MAG: hypothetical protein S4CHLAM20_13290 [Chlamydiia bacterium]|nr:hypothetical protein [Chlamydiia bacterium]
MFSQKYLALDSKLANVDPNKKAHLLSYLPERIKEKLSSSFLPERTIPAFMTIEKLKRRVDVSHFKHYLKSLPSAERNFYIAAFPQYLQPQLCDEEIPLREFKSEKFSDFVLNSLFSKALNDFPPPTLLPFHPIIELLSDTGISLAKLCYYLGLLDVAAEIKKIISQERLKTLQKIFNTEEITFMNKMAADKRPILSSMNLNSYDGDNEKLKTLILSRGMYRFCQGIKQAPAPYRFFFTYFLPKHLSDQMTQLLKQKPIFALSYKNWVEDAITSWRFLCTYSK